MTTLRGLSNIRTFFRTQRTPAFYICTIPYNLLGLRRWVNDLYFVAADDFFAGALPGSFAPHGLDPGADDSFERMNARLLAAPGVQRFIAGKGPGGKALFLMFDAENEAQAQALGLEVCLPPATLRRTLDDKLVTTRMAEGTGIRCVPHVLGPVDGYPTLRRMARHLGPDLVIQLPFGDSGSTTFFVSDESDYARHALAIEGAPEVKIMRRIRCRPAAIEACVTRLGVAVGPLATELCGFPQLTPYRGGWCGNEIGGDLFTPALRDAAMGMARRFGERLAKTGYRGVFGLDFLLDEDSGELLLGELNPRITGLTPLTTQVAADLDCIPLLLLHLLEWSGVDYDIDLDDLNARFSRLSGARSWSQLIVKQTATICGTLIHAPPSGIWQLGPDLRAGFVRPAFEPAAIGDENEALLVRTVKQGSARPRGACLARLIAPGRMMTSEYLLTPRAHAWINAIGSAFETPTATPGRGVGAPAERWSPILTARGAVSRSPPAHPHDFIDPATAPALTWDKERLHPDPRDVPVPVPAPTSAYSGVLLRAMCKNEKAP